MSTTNEREALIATPDRHRGFLLLPAAGLTEEQSRTASTVSQLTIAGPVEACGRHRGAVDGVRCAGCGGLWRLRCL